MQNYCRSIGFNLHLVMGHNRVSSRYSGTFVSNRLKIDEKELQSVIDSMGSPTRPATGGCVDVRECYLCDKGNKKKADNIWKLRIFPNGAYNCFRCSISGGFHDLKNKLNLSDSNNFNNKANSTPSSSNQYHIDSQKILREERGSLDPTSDQITQIGKLQSTFRQFTINLFPWVAPDSNDSLSSDVQAVQKYLYEKRELQRSVLMKYGVGITSQPFQDDNNNWVEKVCLTFPWMKLDLSSSDGNYIIERVKCRALETKGLQRLLPKGGVWGFFGWHTVRDHHTKIIITEGEYDAMAVSQALNDLTDENPSHQFIDVPVISLPNGCSSLPVELLPQLERFQTIYLWLDNDKPGIENSEKIAKKLGFQRCLLVRPDPDFPNPPKDANDALRQVIPGQPSYQLIYDLLLQAKPHRHQKLTSFKNMKLSIINAIHGNDNTYGTLTPSLPGLTNICKGFRRGEVVIVTGPTGSGKTTLLSQLSIDFAKQGQPTLWGSFEIKNSILMKKMLTQYANCDLRTCEPDKLDQIISDFDTLPLKFMSFHGGTEIKEILEVMDFSAYQDDINHIIIDNLQFLMPRESGTSISRLDSQDAILDQFRKFATEKNINLIIVIHPRKEEENVPLTLASISGTSKATQEADTVIILQKIRGETYLDVKKNRYDGQLGRVPLEFDNVSSTYREMPQVNITNPSKIK